MRELRLEKKFVYNEGDNSYNFFIINSMLKQTYPKRKVNSIYFDTYNHRDVWENINGFGERKKIRVRWYDELNNSKVFIEIKKKINFVTQKEVEEINTFKNYNSLISFLDSEKFHNNYLRNKFKDNLKKTVFVQYERNYYELPNKKLRVTLDKNLNVLNHKTQNYLKLDEVILELKYRVQDSNFINNFALDFGLDNRNRKFSKYVNSFIKLNDSGLV